MLEDISSNGSALTQEEWDHLTSRQKAFYWRSTTLRSRNHQPVLDHLKTVLLRVSTGALHSPKWFQDYDKYSSKSYDISEFLLNLSKKRQAVSCFAIRRLLKY